MKRIGSFIAGLLIGAMFFSGTVAYAAGIIAERSSHRFFVDGKEVEMTAYGINGNNYVMLRDIGKAVGFNVYWDSVNNCVQIESDKPYTGVASVGSNAVSAPKKADYSQADVKPAPQVGDQIICSDGYAYEITDVSESFNAMADKVQESLQELIDQQDSISENFATILSNKSGESGNHVKRVGEYSAILAQELGFDESRVHDVRIAAMLHDVGKIMIDEKILHKPGRFTEEEYRIMQQHVDFGGQLLQGVPGNIMQLGAIIAQYHHERWDGTGYTHRLKGDEIPVEAQIASVADVFDALVSHRCYKEAWTIEQAREEILAQRGRQFSPAAVDAFERRFEDFRHIAEVYRDEL